MLLKGREGADGGANALGIRGTVKTGDGSAMVIDEENRWGLRDTVARGEVWPMGEVDLYVRQSAVLGGDCAEHPPRLRAACAVLGAELHERCARSEHGGSDVLRQHRVPCDGAFPALASSEDEPDHDRDRDERDDEENGDEWGHG